MDTPSERTLHLLSLLQSGGEWSVPLLAERLEVSERTVRRDAQRLRSLGYDVRNRPGPGASYRLKPGTKIPPLLFTKDEVAALAAGLSVLGAWLPDDASTATALTKLEQVLPRELRARASATALATQVLQQPKAVIDWNLVGTLADAIAACKLIRFQYIDQHGHHSTRVAEPFRHMLRNDRWYLIAFDTNRDDWRLFCIDRISHLEERPEPFEPREFPHRSIELWLTTDFGRIKMPMTQ